MLVYETFFTTHINLSERWTADREVGSRRPAGSLKSRKRDLFFDAELGSKENKWAYKSVTVLRRAWWCFSCPRLAAANSSAGSRSLLIPTSSLNLSNLPPPTALFQTSVLYFCVFFFFFFFSTPSVQFK